MTERAYDTRPCAFLLPDKKPCALKESNSIHMASNAHHAYIPPVDPRPCGHYDCPPEFCGVPTDTRPYGNCKHEYAEHENTGRAPCRCCDQGAYVPTVDPRDELIGRIKKEVGARIAERRERWAPGCASERAASLSSSSAYAFDRIADLIAQYEKGAGR